jgi:hypothetical protein
MDLEALLEEVVWRNVPDKAVEVYQKYASVIEAEWEKQGRSDFLHQLGQYMNMIPGQYPGGIPNDPAPLTAMLVGGLAGAGLGYGAGFLGESVLPRHWRRGNLRNTLAAAGGAVGMLPGATWGAINASDGRNFNDNTLFQQPAGPNPVEDYSDVTQHFKVLDHIPPELQQEVKMSFKQAAELHPGAGFAGPGIDIDKFIHDVWEDPRVAGPLSRREQAAATGLLYGAANLPGKRNTQIVTPFDVARMAAGMGTGYLSGMLVGKALGIMSGMPDKTQDTLKTTGMYAGLIANLVPLVFGAR